MNDELLRLVEREIGDFKREHGLTEDALYWEWGLNEGRVTESGVNLSQKMHANKMFYRKNWKGLGLIDLLRIMQDDLARRILSSLAAKALSGEEGCPVQEHEKVVELRPLVDINITKMIQGCKKAPMIAAQACVRMRDYYDTKAKLLARVGRG